VSWPVFFIFPQTRSIAVDKMFKSPCLGCGRFIFLLRFSCPVRTWVGRSAQRQHKHCCMGFWLSSLPFPRPPSLPSVMARLMVIKRSVVFAGRHFPPPERQVDGSLCLVQTLKSAAFSHDEQNKKQKCSDIGSAAAFSIPSPQLASWETRASGFRLFRLCCSAAFSVTRSPASHGDFLPSR